MIEHHHRIAVLCRAVPCRAVPCRAVMCFLPVGETSQILTVMVMGRDLTFNFPILIPNPKRVNPALVCACCLPLGAEKKKVLESKNTRIKNPNRP